MKPGRLGKHRLLLIEVKMHSTRNQVTVVSGTQSFLQQATIIYGYQEFSCKGFSCILTISGMTKWKSQIDCLFLRVMSLLGQGKNYDGV